MGKKITIEFVKIKTREIAEGYECLSDEYVNAINDLEIDLLANRQEYPICLQWGAFTMYNNRSYKRHEEA